MSFKYLSLLDSFFNMAFTLSILSMKLNQVSVINWFVLGLGFNDTSTLMGHFVVSSREKEKREEIEDEMKEKDREEIGTGMKVKKKKK